MEVEQHISGTNILVLAPGDKHSATQHKRRNDVKKQAWAVGGCGDHQIP